MPATSPVELETRRNGLDRVVINSVYTRSFPPAQFPSYDSYRASPSERLKHEHGTTIWRIAPGDGRRTFILKEYRFSSATYFRTLFSRPRAEREFLALARTRELGLPCVEPVAFGVRPRFYGGVRACFLITPELEDRQTLKAWLQSHRRPDPAAAEKLNALLKEVGASLRKMHEAGFFPVTLFPKNLLIVDCDDRLDWILIDLPHAQTPRSTPMRRWIQTRDIGGFLESVTKHVGPEFEEAFYRAYLPGPFGRGEAGLRAAAARGGRTHRKRAWWRRLFGIAK